MNTPIRASFLYLMNLAYKSRLHIPFLLTVCFLVFDIRLQVEVNINMTRHRANERLGIEANNIEEEDISGIPSTDSESDEDDDDDDDDDDDEDNDDFNYTYYDDDEEAEMFAITDVNGENSCQCSSRTYRSY